MSVAGYRESMRYSWLPSSLLIAAFVAFLGTAVGVSHSLAQLLQRDAERSQALRTQAELQRLLTLLIDVETGQRGFIMTGQQQFLRPYEEALTELAQLRTGLRERLAFGGASPAGLQRLDALIDERLTQTKATIQRRLASGADPARDLSAYVDGKRVMDDLRFEIKELAQQQQERVTRDEALELYGVTDVIRLGRLADQVKRRRWGTRAHFVINRQINPSNVCVLSCRFCDFATKRGRPNTLSGMSIRPAAVPATRRAEDGFGATLAVASRSSSPASPSSQ